MAMPFCEKTARVGTRSLRRQAFRRQTSFPLFDSARLSVFGIGTEYRLPFHVRPQGLLGGFFVAIAALIYAFPIGFVAAVVGFPAYRFCSRGSSKLIVIWLGYSVASAVSTAIVLIIAKVVFPGEELIPEFPGLLMTGALVVAIPSSLFAKRLGQADSSSDHPEPSRPDAGQDGPGEGSPRQRESG